MNYGVIVCTYEPGKTKHSVYEIGDIVIAINGQICTNYEDFTRLKPAGKNYKVSLLRPDSSGRLVVTDITVSDGQPKVQLLDMTESE